MNIHKFLSFQIFIVFCTLAISFSYETFILDSETKKDTYKQKELLLKLECDKIELKDYILIKVKGLESVLTPHIIEYCQTESCDNRIQLAHRPTLINYLWITKEQAEENNFIKITSLEEECYYELEITTTEQVNMFTNSEYTYYVSEKNQKMTFSFLKNVENFDFDFFTSITIWIIGEKMDNILINSDIIKNHIKKDGKNLYSLPIIDNKNIEITVEAEEGCLVTIGSILVEKSNYSSQISLNTTEVYGYLTTSDDQKQMCYTLSKSDFELNETSIIFLSAIIYEGIGEIHFNNLDGLVNEPELITTGYANYKISPKKVLNSSFCISIPNDEKYNKENIIYSIQVSTNLKYNFLLHNRQNLGEFYSRIVQKNSEFSSFFVIPPIDKNMKIKYNTTIISGFPEMYFDTCETYPICIYNDDSSYQNAKKINIVNPINIIHSIKPDEKITAISPKQNILIAKCIKGEYYSYGNIANESDYNIETCEINNIIYSIKENISQLFENQIINHYIVKDEMKTYSISNISNEQIENFGTLIIELMIYSGDVIFDEIDEYKYQKYQTANKITYCINFRMFFM
jgi:hypothetical protein